MVITGVKFFQIELKPVRRARADASLKRFQHKVLKARRKPTQNMGDCRAQIFKLKKKNAYFNCHPKIYT